MKKVLVGLSVAFQVAALIGLGLIGAIRAAFVFVVFGVLSLILSLVLGRSSESDSKQKPVKETLVEQIRPNALASCNYFDRYIEYVKGKHGEGAAKRTREDVEDLLGNKKKTGRINELVTERGANARVKGLVVGRVQSGKTQNFTGLITKAIDNGWRIILVLTSNNTALKDQTVARLEYDLQKSGLDYKKRDYELINGFCGQIPCVNQNGITIGIALKEKNHLEGVSNWLKENEYALSSSGVLVIDDEADNATQNSAVGEDAWSDDAVIEYANRLISDNKPNPGDDPVEQMDKRKARVIAEWVLGLVDNPCEVSASQAGCVLGALNKETNDVKDLFEREEWQEFRRAIRVDECKDVMLCTPQPIAGLIANYIGVRNEGVGRGHLSRKGEITKVLQWIVGVRRERSVINQAICDIVDSRTRKFAKLAYVGYTATPYANFLNERRGADNPLELDFAQSMQLFPEYFGLAKIFGEDGTDNARMPIVHEVAEDKNDAIDNLNGPSHESPLEVAIQWAFCCAALRRASRIGQKIADDDSSKRDLLVTTMLVNVSRKQTDHRAQSETIKRYLASKLRDSAAREAFRKSCLSTFDSLSKGFSANQFKKEFAYEIGQGVFKGVRDLSQADVKQNIDYFFDKYRVDVLNSSTENLKVYSDYIGSSLKGDELWIIIGGNRISRGLTFYGLVATYFDRESPTLTVETLTQMGRWFGYRPGYELMPRVWMPTGSVNTLKEICRLEEDLHTQIGQMFAVGDSRPNPLMKLISMRLTGRDAGAERLTGIENPITTNEIYSDEKKAVESVKVVGEFIKCLGPEWTREDGDKNDRVYTQLHRWHEVRIDVINNNLIEPMSDLLPNGSANRLKQAVGAVTADSWNVVLADPRNEEPIVEFGNIQVHINGASEWGSVAPNEIRFGKFTGQYDAWRAVAPVKYVQKVEEEFENRRVNTQDAWNSLFEKMANDKNCAADAQRPILQVGFLPVGKEKNPVAYISIYWPRHDEICGASIGRGDVLDNARKQTSPVKAVSKTPLPDSEIENSFGSWGERDDGLTEEQRGLIKGVLANLARSDCPWYKVGDLKDEIKECVSGSSRLSSALTYALEHGWGRTQIEQENGEVFFPIAFAQNGDEAIFKIKQSFLSAVKSALVESVPENEELGVAGEDLWESAKKIWNKKHHGVFKQKIDRVITKNKVLPARKCPTVNVDGALGRLNEYGIRWRVTEDNKYYYSAHRSF